MVESVSDVPDVRSDGQPEGTAELSCMVAVSDHQHRDDFHIPSNRGMAMYATLPQLPHARQGAAELGGTERRCADYLRDPLQVTRCAVCRPDLQRGVLMHAGVALGARHDADGGGEEISTGYAARERAGAGAF